MKKVICALCIGFLCTMIIHSDFKSTEAALAESVIRLHVLANSNSAQDQSLKLKVRDRIIKETSGIIDSVTISAARDDIEKNIHLIEQIARDEIKSNGYSYPVKVSLGMSSFPTKEYGELILPAGTYEALKVEIGEAKGQNWWCVLFPPLCFVDETCITASREYVSEIESQLGDSNKEFVSKDKSAAVEFRFRAYELWQSGKRKIAMVFAKNKV